MTEKNHRDRAFAVAMIGTRGFYVRQSGLETHVRELARGLASRGCSVTVYGRNTDEYARIPPDPAVDAGIEIRDGLCSRGKFTATLVNTVWATIHAMRSQRFDVLHYHGVGCVFAVLLAKFSSMPVVLTLHSTNWEEQKWSSFSGWLIHWLERVAVKASNAVVSVSQAIGDRTQWEYGRESHVIAPGSGAYLQRDIGRDDQVIEELGLERGKYILFVGRLIADKGCHVLLEALKKSRLPMKLVLAGPVLDRDYCSDLEKMGGDKLVLAGVRADDDLGTLYRHCGFFCLASTTEGLPIALIDALAHGTPCLVSDIDGHRQLVTDSRMRFPPGDAPALAAKLVELYERCGEMSLEHRHAVGTAWLQEHHEYSFDGVTDQVHRIYESLRAG